MLIRITHNSTDQWTFDTHKTHCLYYLLISTYQWLEEMLAPAIKCHLLSSASSSSTDRAFLEIVHMWLPVRWKSAEHPRFRLWSFALYATSRKQFCRKWMGNMSWMDIRRQHAWSASFITSRDKHYQCDHLASLLRKSGGVVSIHSVAKEGSFRREVAWNSWGRQATRVYSTNSREGIWAHRQR